MSLVDRQDDLQQTLDQLVDKYGVPGSSVAVMDGDEVITAVSGVAHLGTGAPMTVDTPFLIGSITKVWTATLVMQLVDEGLVDLDAPVRAYLPTFRLADEDLAASVTVRHLMTHTDGIDASDWLFGYGRGDDALANYVDALAERGRLFDPGQMWSYDNAAWCLSGRIVEVLRGTTWAAALREHLIGPLGLTNTVNGPEEALVAGASVGHIAWEGTTYVCPTWMYAHSIAAAGATLCCSARDLLAFGKAHLEQGRTPAGGTILSPDAAATMAAHHIDLPYAGLAMGVGWWRTHVFGDTVGLTHAGGSPGGMDTIAVFPDRGSGFVHYTNLPGGGLQPELERFISEELLGLGTPVQPGTPVADDPLDLDLSVYEGVYERTQYRLTVTAEDDHLLLLTEGHGGVYPHAPFTVGPQVVRAGTPAAWRVDHGPNVTFLEFEDSGRPEYIHTGARAHRRVR